MLVKQKHRSEFHHFNHKHLPAGRPSCPEDGLVLTIEGKAQSRKGVHREERGPASVKLMGFQVGPCANIFPVCHVQHRERRAQEQRCHGEPESRHHSGSAAPVPREHLLVVCHTPKMRCVTLLHVLPWSAGAPTTAAAVLHLQDDNTRQGGKTSEHYYSSLTQKQAST